MSKKLFEYNGYLGSAEISIEDSCAHGKILFINDVVTYESDSVKELEAEFRLAVDDYLETCIEIDKEPDKTMKGTFNVRIGAELHKKALIRSKSDGVTLNEVIKTSVEQYVNSAAEIHNHVNLNVHKHEAPKPTITTQTFETSPYPVWKQSKDLQHESH
jgi:predicted HicB family RNase H-like nuclease